MIWVGMEELSDGNSVVGFAAFFTARSERPIHSPKFVDDGLP